MEPIRVDVVVTTGYPAGPDEVGMAGFWVGRGAPAVVDWCEPNYVVTPYVAEFWNTVSSLPMAILGLAGVLWWWNRRSGADPVPRRIALCFAGLAVVGLGSTAFHGTLLRPAQALDELPMVWVGLVGAWVVRFRDRPAEEGWRVAVGMAVYGALFTVAYFVSSATFLVFLATYTALVAYVAIRSMAVTWWAPSPAIVVRLLAVAAGGFLGAFFFLWIPEHVLLGCDHPLQRVPLHALWHLGSGGGTFAWCLWAVADRRRVQGVASRWSGWFVEAA